MKKEQHEHRSNILNLSSSDKNSDKLVWNDMSFNIYELKQTFFFVASTSSLMLIMPQNQEQNKSVLWAVFLQRHKCAQTVTVLI